MHVDEFLGCDTMVVICMSKIRSVVGVLVEKMSAFCFLSVYLAFAVYSLCCSTGGQK